MKYELEYPINSSINILFDRLSTLSGLSEWFADDVNVDREEVYTFTWEGSEQQATLISKKKNDHVKCLFNISLEKYCCNISDCKDYNYELYAVCNHYGGTTGGHYTANVKNPINSLWFEFNDDSIYHIDVSNVITESAYLLFYKKIL